MQEVNANYSLTYIALFLSHLLFQMEQVKQDLSRKDSELLGLQTKLETLTNQFSDSKQHIEVLKESLTAKEQRAAILQTEVRQKHVYALLPKGFRNMFTANILLNEHDSSLQVLPCDATVSH